MPRFRHGGGPDVLRKWQPGHQRDHFADAKLDELIGNRQYRSSINALFDEHFRYNIRTRFKASQVTGQNTFDTSFQPPFSHMSK